MHKLRTLSADKLYRTPLEPDNLRFRSSGSKLILQYLNRNIKEYQFSSLLINKFLALMGFPRKHSGMLSCDTIAAVFNDLLTSPEISAVRFYISRNRPIIEKSEERK